MNNNTFSVRSLFSVPTAQNERVLPEKLADSIITILTMLDLYANKQYGLFPEEEIKNNGLTFSMRSELRKKWYVDTAFIDGFISENGQELEAFVPLISMWKHRVSGKFLVMKYFPEYALLQSLDNTDAFFAVKALTEDFEETIPQKPPYVIQTTLLPFYDTIIWDGIVMLADINIDTIAAKEIMEAAKKVRRYDAVIKSLIKFEDTLENEIQGVNAQQSELTENKE